MRVSCASKMEREEEKIESSLNAGACLLGDPSGAPDAASPTQNKNLTADQLMESFGHTFGP